MANVIAGLLSGAGSKIAPGIATIGEFGKSMTTPLISNGQIIKDGVPLVFEGTGHVPTMARLNTPALIVAADAVNANLRSNINLNKSTDAYAATKRRMGETGNTGVNIKEYANDLLQTNKISQKEYDNFVQNVDLAQSKLSGSFDNFGGNLWTVLKSFGSDMLPFGTNSKKNRESFEKVLNMIDSEYLSKPLEIPTLEALEGAIWGPNGKPAGPSAPTMLSEINPEAGTVPVDPVYWWRGKEMADLYDLDYDIDTYYDLIKKGTAARVAARDYMNDVATNASLVNDTRDIASYLKSISDAKAAANIKGATLGARMAADLLQNNNASQAYSTNQTQVAQNNFNAIKALIDEDARARLTATEYFSKNVAQPVMSNIEGIYWDDINRRGAQLNANAELYAANQGYNGAVAAANMANLGAYEQAKANYEAAMSSATKGANDYITYWNLFYTDAKNNGLSEQAARYKAKMDTQNLIQKNAIDSYTNIYNNGSR